MFTKVCKFCGKIYKTRLNTSHCSRSCSKKGKPTWSKGKKCPSLSIALKGHLVTEETKKKISETLKRKGGNGWNQTKESKAKISKSLSGRKLSEEHKKKVGASKKGEKCHWWQGGRSFDPYTVDWTRSLRIAIRERDLYTCRICGEKQEQETFAVHHIDYNKENCDLRNLITLCRSCHSKTNSNRGYWKEFFGEML